MGRKVVYENEARTPLLEGLGKLTKAVKVTLGPLGRNVIIGKQYGDPHLTKDGVTVANEFKLDNKLEDIGAQLGRSVSTKTNDLAGDGTTTATVLAHAIVSEGMNMVSRDCNPLELKKGIDYAIGKIVEQLEDMSLPAHDMYKAIATVSANNDEFLGGIIGDSFERVGEDGIVTSVESKGSNTTVDFVEGMKFAQGFISPYFVTDTERMVV